jgi:hypothetical protein
MVRIDTSQISGRLNEDIESVVNQLLFLYYVADYRPTKDELLKGFEKAINNYYDNDDN